MLFISLNVLWDLIDSRKLMAKFFQKMSHNALLAHELTFSDYYIAVTSPKYRTKQLSIIANPGSIMLFL